MKIQERKTKTGTQLFVYLPKHIVEAFCIKKGDLVHVYSDKDRIVIEKN